MLKYFTDWRNLKKKVRWMLYTRQRKKLSLLWRCAPKPVVILQSVSSQGSARYMTLGHYGFSTMTTHNDIRTYLMHPACFPGHAQMLQTASAAFGRFDLHLVWSELMLVIKIHWKWSLDTSLRTHKKNTWNAYLLHTAGQRFVNICCCFKAVTGREINLFFPDSRLAPKFFRVVANSKNVRRHF